MMPSLVKPIALLWLLTLLLAACGGGSTNADEAPSLEATAAEPTLPEPTAEVTPSPQPVVEEPSPTAAPAQTLNVNLDERTALVGFDFSIAHPSGWLVAQRAPVTMISESSADHENALRNNAPPSEGYQVSLDHRDLGFMQGLGLPEEASLQDLFDLNAAFFEWSRVSEPTEVEVFGSPALAVRALGDDGFSHVLMGFANEEAFLLTLAAPSEDALDTFMPTWESMLDSIEAEE